MFSGVRCLTVSISRVEPDLFRFMALARSFRKNFVSISFPVLTISAIVADLYNTSKWKTSFKELQS